jgi:PTS system cellobiose-specific IIC component
MFIVNRRRNKQMIALGTPPGLFNINEPIIFGLPIVLNPIWLVPFICTPIILTIISYLAVQTHLVFPIVSTIPWVTPPIIGGYLATGGHWSGAVLAAVNLVISVIIYLPFVVAAERLEAKKSSEASSDNSLPL